MKKLLSNDFNRNVITLLTGTTVAQALPIAVSPILTRLYSPADFGVFALFISITAIFAAIVNGKYELAIVIPEKDEDAYNIAALSLIIAAGISLFLLLIIVVFHSWILKILNNDQISPWLYVIPLVIFLSGLYNMLNYLNTRLKNFRHISNATIFKSLTTAVIQLGLGFFKFGAAGLITGQIFSNIVGNTTLLFNVLRNKVMLTKINKSEMIRLARLYKDYPKYNILSTTANTLSENLTSIFISSLYSLSTLGFYSLVQRILVIPSRLIGSSIGQVYFQRASVERNEKGHAKDTFNSTLKKLLIIGLPTFVVLFFSVEWLIVFFFGENWQVAGEYAKIILPLTFFRFIVSPLSVTSPLFNKNKFLMIWQLGLLFINLFIFGCIKTYDLSITYFLYANTVILSLYYLYFFYKLRNHSHGRD